MDGADQFGFDRALLDCPGRSTTVGISSTTEALNAERRRAWNDARALARTEAKWGRGRPATDAPPRPGHELGRANSKVPAMRCGRTPRNLTERQSEKLAWIAKTDTRLYRAYLLKEGPRHVFSVKRQDSNDALDKWISWARRCRIPAFVELARRIAKHRDTIDAHQHQDPTPDPDCVRIPQPRRADRPGHARPRRPPPHTARPRLTPTRAPLGGVPSPTSPILPHRSSASMSLRSGAPHGDLPRRQRQRATIAEGTKKPSSLHLTGAKPARSTRGYVRRASKIRLRRTEPS